MCKYTRTGTGWGLWKKKVSSKKWIKVDNFSTKSAANRIAIKLRKKGYQAKTRKVKMPKYKKN